MDTNKFQARPLTTLSAITGTLGLLAIAGLGAEGTALGGMTPVELPTFAKPCAGCQLVLENSPSLSPVPRSRFGGQILPQFTAQRAPGTVPSTQVPQLGADLAHLFTAPSPIQYPTIDTSGTNWDGQGPLPGAFRPTWTFAKTNFDPSFQTPYWTEASGFSNVASAPWQLVNSGSKNCMLDSAEIFSTGMGYLGSYDYGSLGVTMLPLEGDSELKSGVAL